MMTSFLEGLAAGYGIAIPVGAVAILIVNTSLGSGFRRWFSASERPWSSLLIRRS